MITNEKMNEFCGTSDIDYQGEFALTFLMKYAVPKVINYSNDDYMLTIKGQGKDPNPDPDDDGEWWEVTIDGTRGVVVQVEDKDPATALRKAIESIWEDG